MKYLESTITAICFFLMLSTTTFAQLQDRLYAGFNNSGTNLEICYAVTNTANSNITLASGSENQITILYGKAPLDGYMTEANPCLDLLSYDVSSVHPDIDPASFIATETQGKLLWFNFETKADLNVPIGNEVELFCFNWTVTAGACSDLVYWTFCDEEVADTYYDDYNIFPLGSDCTEGNPQASNLAPVLPVVLSDFFGKSTSNGNKLSWTTSSEVNNNYFVIERSLDGINYQNIGHVQSRANSNKLTNYDFTDNNIEYGAYYYYRLGQFDFDGTFTQFPKIVNIKGEQKRSSLSLFPVPVSDVLNFNFENEGASAFTIMIVNSTGQLILEKQMSKNERAINTNQLASGMYNLVIVKNTETIKKKFLKL